MSNTQFGPFLYRRRQIALGNLDEWAKFEVFCPLVDEFATFILLELKPFLGKKLQASIYHLRIVEDPLVF